MITQEVILVNEHDVAIGTMEKLEAHQKGLLHRAFSVFIFNKEGRMLLQQRARHKYHGAHLWTNACCSHPYPNEITKNAAERRLKEELGFSTRIQEIFSFLYKADVENQLVEHEYDHVFAGEYDQEINPNELEVANIDYREMADIKKDIELNPTHYTSWFKIAFPRIEKWWQENYNNVSVNSRVS